MVKVITTDLSTRITIVDRIFHARGKDVDRDHKRRSIIVSGLISSWEEPQDFLFYIPLSADCDYALGYLMDQVMKGRVVELGVDDNEYLKLGIKRDPVAINIEWFLNWWEKPAEKKTLHISQMPKE